MRTPKIVRRSLLVAGLIASVGIWSTPVMAAPDNKPPTLRVGLKPAFVVGTVISAAQPYDVDPQNGYTTDIAQAMKWTATDNVGVCTYDLSRVFAGQPPEIVFEYDTHTQFTDMADDYDGTFGGGAVELTGWFVTARDCAGNETKKHVYTFPTVTQEDNADAGHPAAGKITYKGTWTNANCECSSAGSTKKSTDEGARATFTRTYTKGDHVALVMGKGPKRGRAAIFMDGMQVAVIDTFAPEITDRVVVFERRMAAGEHTITIENLATAERHRIDLDAILTN